MKARRVSSLFFAVLKAVTFVSGCACLEIGHSAAQTELDTSVAAENGRGEPVEKAPKNAGTGENGALLKIENVPVDHLQNGKVALAKNDLQTARTEFEILLSANPNDLAALVSLGWISQRERLWEESEAHLRQAVKLAVEDGAVWLALGIACLEQEKWEGATAAFSQTVFLEPKNARARRFLGLTLGKRGWLDGAEQELRKSLELDPNDAGAHFNLAVFYLQRRPASVELARRHYYRAIDLGFASDVEIEAKLAKVVNR